MTQSTNEKPAIYEAYIEVVVKEDFGKPTAKRMRISAYRGPSKRRAVMAYTDLGTAHVTNCRVVEHGWQVIEPGGK